MLITLADVCVASVPTSAGCSVHSGGDTARPRRGLQGQRGALGSGKGHQCPEFLIQTHLLQGAYRQRSRKLHLVGAEEWGEPGEAHPLGCSLGRQVPGCGAAAGVKAAGPEVWAKPLVPPPRLRGKTGRRGLGSSVPQGWAAAAPRQHRETHGAELPGQGGKTPDRYELVGSTGSLLQAVRSCE